MTKGRKRAIGGLAAIMTVLLAVGALFALPVRETANAEQSETDGVTVRETITAEWKPSKTFYTTGEDIFTTILANIDEGLLFKKEDGETVKPTLGEEKDYIVTLETINTAGHHTLIIELKNTLYQFDSSGKTTAELEFDVEQGSARLDISSSTISYGSFGEAWDAVHAMTWVPFTITLYAQQSCEGFTVESSIDFTLDLNGYMMIPNSGIKVEGKFTLKDSSNSSGKIEGGIDVSRGSFKWAGGNIGTVSLETGTYIEVQEDFTAPTEQIAIKVDTTAPSFKVLSWENGTDDPTAHFKSEIEAACYYRVTAERAAYIGKHSLVYEEPTWSGHTSVEFKDVRCEHEGCGKTTNVTLEGERIEEGDTVAATCTQDGSQPYSATLTLEDVQGVFDIAYSTWGASVASTLTATTSEEMKATGHAWRYTAAANGILTATCSHDYHDESKDGNKEFGLTIKAPTETIYQASDIVATVSGDIDAEPFESGYTLTYRYNRETSSGYTDMGADELPKNAGYYQAVLTAKDDKGSPKTEATLEFEIEKATLTVTAKGHEITYGDEPSHNGVEYSGFVSGEDVNVLGGTLEYSYDYEQFGDVGESYTITPSGYTSNNYDIHYEVGTLKVKAKSVTVEIAVPENLTYNDIGEFTAEVQGLVHGDAVTATLTFNGTRNDGSAFWDSAVKPMHAGSYTVKATGLSGDRAKNYTITADGEQSFTIGKATVAEPERDGTAFTYTGVEQVYTVSRSDLYTVSGNKQTNADSYTVTIALTDKYNYKWETANSSDDLFYAFVIGKATLTVTAHDNEITYGDAPSNRGVEYEGFVNDEDEKVLGGMLEYSYDYEQFGDIGESYTITPSGYTSSNYDIRFVAGTLKVNAKEISAEWGEKSYTYSGSAFNLPTATAEGIGKDGAFALKVSPSFAGEFKNAGSYHFKAELDSSNAKAKNYTLKEGTTTHTYTVEKQTVTVPTISGKVYNGAKQTAEVAPSTLYKVTENNGGINVGSYNVKLTLADHANYKWADGETAELVLTFTITKATYDMSGVTFEDVTVDYDGQMHSIEIKGTLPNGVTVTYEGNGKKSVGEYTVTATFTGDARNYNAIPSMTALLKILAISHDLSGIKFEDVTVKYDGNAHSIYIEGTLPTNVTVSYEGNGQTDPNIYTVTAVFSDSDGEFDRKTATLIILRTHTQTKPGDGSGLDATLDSEDGFDPTAELVVEKSENIARTYWVWEKDNVSEKYDVKMCKDGAEVPFDGKVTVRLLIPEEFRDRDFELRTVKRAENIAFTRDGDYVVFETEGLSEYIFASDYTPYFPIVIIMVAALCVDILGMIVLVIVIKKRRTAKEESEYVS